MAFNFESLEVWKKAQQLTKKIYCLTELHPEIGNDPVFTDLRQCAIKIPVSLVGDNSNPSIKDKVRTAEDANKALMHTMGLVLVAYELGYIDPDALASLRIDIEEISRMLNGYRRSLLNKIGIVEPKSDDRE